MIEHVNYPFQTLQCAANVLKQGGFLLIDTPCRDSFYHHFGEFTYRLTGGRSPTFLNAMYSSHLFGHKQIFSTGEMKQLFEEAGLQVIDLHKFHELSFPYDFYLKKLLQVRGIGKTFAAGCQSLFQDIQNPEQDAGGGKENVKFPFRHCEELASLRSQHLHRVPVPVMTYL